ncbi:MAG: methylated-DNA--[protein]-cysteine S-methyltransferase [Prevotella sp.]|nr:methylated-DNA--[protein]-cysteine S-methyltransferase [Prevotella sp.]MDY5321054.1 methylated-DNA--[protein]-cysteine S-methyltransferase [Prevotella sp.]
MMMDYNFERIAEAIRYIESNRKRQPSLEDVARHVCLSPFHFQRMFTAWAGISPKRFLEYLNVEYAKRILAQSRLSLLTAANEVGLSSTSRLYDLFVHIEGMTPGEYRSGGASLRLHYVLAHSPFGQTIIASTAKGISYIAFADKGKEEAVATLQRAFPLATLSEQADEHNSRAAGVFRLDWGNVGEVRLHLRGTNFQIKVWESLVRVPAGRLTTYSQLAQAVGSPKAVRAVGSAVAGNPVALLIPCHRVIRSTGGFGNYHWRPERKAAIIGWEAAHCGAKEE